MLYFESDYNRGAHDKVLEKLIQTNFEPLVSYGEDVYSKSAKEKIMNLCNNKDAQVFLLTGGTQTNRIIINSILSDYEGVIAADTGHINTHEAGAIESTGHKVITVANNLGKISASDVDKLVSDFYSDDNHEHAVFPGMVYISFPTEYGTLYTLNELESLSSVCRKYDLPLFVDGARLGYGLVSSDNDVSIEDIARLSDVFYIGGTKVGALCGEAVVFTHNNAPKHFFTTIKQQGALLAKGRLLGVQFDALFTDDLYFIISKHAIDMADRMREGFLNKGYEFYIETTTNQIFVVFDDDKLNKIKDKVTFSFWEKLDNNKTVVRFASSWSTTIEDVNALIDIL